MRRSAWGSMVLAAALVAPVAAAKPGGLPAGAAARIDALFADWSGSQRPGCAVGVERDGSLAFARGYGMADLEQGVAIGPGTVFDIGSVSKQFTAASIAVLSIEGKLGLDDDIRKFLPELSAYSPPVTIRHLLHHRSGLRDYTTLMSIAGDDTADLTTTEQALAMIARQHGVDFPAGDHYDYSNTGYFLLGVIVERASGEPLARFAAERIFAPLGMRSTHFHDDHTRIVPRRAQGYAVRDGGFGIDMSDWEQIGDGSLFTTVEDLARWTASFESAALGARFVELMQSPGLPDDDSGVETYGFAQRVTRWRGRPAFRHSGSWAGYRANLFRLPDQRVAVSILCNFDRTGGLGTKVEQVAAIALGEPLDPPVTDADDGEKPVDGAVKAEPLTGARLELLAGRFWSDELQTSIELRVASPGISAVGADGVAHDFGRAVDQDPAAMVFEGDGSRLRFESAADGSVDRVWLDVPPSHGIPLRRIDPPAASLRIVNARLLDGSGAPARTASVRITGERIAAVGDLEPQPGEATFDAHGLALAPGFIDTHSHAAGELDTLPEALGAVSQGITTVVAGQDGDSSFPLADFFTRLEKAPAAVNVASYSGHGTLREQVMGKDFRRPATASEVASMSKLLDRDMEAGALGLATGLEYDPGIYSKTPELIALARVAARHGGRYISHVRSEDRWFWEAIEEILTIGREAKLPVQVSHIKLAMRSLWNQAPRLLARLDAARAQGIAVTADIYPYLYWHSTLTVLFPKRDFENLEEARNVLAEIAPPDGLLLGGYKPHPEYAGRTIAEIAKERGEAPEVTLVALIRDAEAMRKDGVEDVENVIGTSMIESDLQKLMAWPETNFCTDGELTGSHPRGFGSFPRVLGRYVREQPVLGLEEAIRKMTSLAADHVGIADRGRIVPGAFADLVLFDPATVIDRATTTEPHLLSAGIERVWVNGKVVYAQGSASGLKPGRVLRRAISR